MDIRTAVRPISQVKTNAAALIRQINETRQPIVITQNGEAKGVLVDPRSYQEMVDALAILKLISHSKRSIELDDAKTHEEVVGALRQVLSSGQVSVRNRRVPSLLPIPPQQVSHMDVAS